MRREQLETILSQGGQVPDTGPIEDHLEALASADEPPSLALAMCTIRIEESATALRGVLERAADGEELTDDEATLLFRGLHVLGAARDAKTCAPLLRLLRRPADDVDALLGDTTTETLPKIVAGVFDGDTDALFAAISDRLIDQYARSSLLDAATFLAWEGRIDRERMQSFLDRFYQERLAEDDEHAWIAWLDAIALLGLRALAPLVVLAWEEGRVPMGILQLQRLRTLSRRGGARTGRYRPTEVFRSRIYRRRGRGARVEPLPRPCF